MLLPELLTRFNSSYLAAAREHLTPAEMYAVSAQRVHAKVGNCTIDSVFQPIVDLQRRVVLGHEAYLRAHNAQGSEISPDEFFAPYLGTPFMLQLDYLCRNLHTLNFLGQYQQAGGYLYLNVHREHLAAAAYTHDLLFEAFLKRCGLAPEDIFLEIQPEATDVRRLRIWVEHFRQRGYGIAIGGLGHNLPDASCLAGVYPDIIKIDVNLLTAQLREQLRPWCKTVVALHIETASDAASALAAGAELGEGFYFGHPEPLCKVTHKPQLAICNNPD